MLEFAICINYLIKPIEFVSWVEINTFDISLKFKWQENNKLKFEKSLKILLILLPRQELIVVFGIVDIGIGFKTE